MKTIKIFVASSEELSAERKELSEIVTNLNFILNKLDINIILVKWEYVDASMGMLHKQEEYNRYLRECEICMVLYWTKFGLYTKTELDVAYDELRAGNNPRKLYVYFKDTDEKEISVELKAFRDSFPEVYGHFNCTFANIDALKTHFLLQFLEYQSQSLKNQNLVEIRDSKIFVGGKESANLMNVAFAGNNEEYNQLLKSIRKTRKILSMLEVDDPDYSEYAHELQSLLKRQQAMEDSLWDTALLITRLSATAGSDRLQRAIELFNKGDNKGADAVLNEEEIARDVKHNLHLIELGEQGRKGLQNNIDEYRLKISTLKVEKDEDWGEKICNIHEQIISLTEKLYGSDSEERADTMIDSVNDFYTLAKYERAETLTNLALQIFLKKLGNEDPKVGRCYNILGLVFSEHADFNRSLEYLKKALGIAVGAGEINDDISVGYNNLGTIYCSLGNYEKALKYHEKALKIQLEIFCENHHDVALSYNNIGLVYDNMGDYEKSLKCHEKALKIQLEIFSENHPDVATSYNNIGCVYDSMGNYEESLKYYGKAQKIQCKIFGENHPAVATTYNNIGLVYTNMGDYEESLNFYEKALKIQVEIFGENHPDVATICNNLGGVYNSMGNHCNSLNYHEKSLKIRLEIFGENHPDVATSYNNIGSVYDSMGDYDKALKYHEKALKIQLEIFGETHPDVATSYNNIGFVYANIGDYDLALKYYEKAIKIHLEIFGETHPDVATSYSNIGGVYDSLGDYNQALKYYEKSLNILLEIFGENHPEVETVRDNISCVKLKIAGMTE